MNAPRQILFVDRRRGTRESRLASEVPAHIREVVVDGEVVPIVQIVIVPRGDEVVIESYDAGGRCLQRTHGR